jgi:hypothetical protein
MAKRQPTLCTCGYAGRSEFVLRIQAKKSLRRESLGFFPFLIMILFGSESFARHG